MTPPPAPCSVGRLTKGLEFQGVYKQGRLFKGKGLWLFIQPSTLPAIKVGFSISSRTVKRAVKRNRLRRIIRSWFQDNRHKIRQACNIVMLVRKEMATNRAGSRLIRDELQRLLSKSEYLCHETRCNRTN